jgi:hypothetical protein
MNPVFIESVGLAAPGLPSWQEGRATLRGESALVPAPLSPHTPTLLPLNERRRATPAVKLAFRAAEDAMQGTSAASLATVFASSDADLAIIHRICLALTATPRLVSPTDLTTSVCIWEQRSSSTSSLPKRTKTSYILSNLKNMKKALL